MTGSCLIGKNPLFSKGFYERMRENINGYLLSPVKTVSNQVIADEFWFNPNVGKLPYYKGVTIAVYLKHMIPLERPGTTLDMFVKELVREGTLNGTKFTWEFFQDRLQDKYLSIETTDKLMDVILNGTALDLSPLNAVLPWDQGAPIQVLQNDVEDSAIEMLEAFIRQ